MYVGLPFEKQEVRGKAEGLVPNQRFVPLGMVKTEEQRLEFPSPPISYRLNQPRLYSSIHKERRLLFCVLRMSNPLISYILGVISKFSIKRNHMNIIKSLIIWIIILWIWTRCCKNVFRGQAGKIIEGEELVRWRMSASPEWGSPQLLPCMNVSLGCKVFWLFYQRGGSKK